MYLLGVTDRFFWPAVILCFNSELDNLVFNHMDSLLQKMNTKEADFINDWKAYMKAL